MKRALITGITGQDGRFLAQFLAEKGYQVFGLIRGQNNPKAEMVARRDAVARARRRRPARPVVADRRGRAGAARRGLQPGAISFVQLSWKQPELTAEITGLGVLRMLEAVRIVGGSEHNPIRFYQASSSEMFGKVRETPQNRAHAVPPPVALRRREGVRPPHDRELPRVVRHARVLGHPVQPRVGEDAASSSSRARSPTRSRASSSGSRSRSRLGNLDSARDYGYAGDYVEAMWLMLQQDEPDDYVIATGRVAHDPRVPRRRVPRRRLRRLDAVRAAGSAVRAPGRGRSA